MTGREARRHPGMIAFRLRWSMSFAWPVRITLRAGGVREGRVVMAWRDPRRDVRNATAQNSTVVCRLEDGEELAVNSIESVAPASARSWEEAERQAVPA